MACSSEGRQPAGASTHRRHIRSYVRREGRLTSAQRQALERLWDRYGLGDIDHAEPPERIDPTAIFGRHGRPVLEIGIGTGQVLAAMAAAQPERGFLGIEVYRPGLGSLLQHLDEAGIDNVRLICADAVLALGRMPDACLEEVYLLFPDPWPKRSHHKRRIVRPTFVAEIGRCLISGGRFHLATDWRDYACHMQQVMETAPAFVNDVTPGAFADRPADRPLSRFERRGLRLGHEVWELRYRRRD